MLVNRSEAALASEDGLSGYSELPYGSAYRRSVDPSVLLAHPVARSLRAGGELCNVGAVRALDLACGSGKQLIGAAAANHRFCFHGVDGTQAHIAQAKAYVELANLDNTSFECADLLNWSYSPEHCGRYDVVTCTGTFAWVPVAVQQSILRIIAHSLSPEGIAAVHVLTKPGALTTVAVQKTLKASIDGREALRTRLHTATAFATKSIPLAQNVATDSGIGVDAAIQAISQRTDTGVAHEYLGGDVSAYYFRELVQMTEEHGLHIVGDATFSVACPASPPEGLPGLLYASAKDWNEQQELLDFFGHSPGGRCILLTKRPRLVTEARVSFSGLHIRLHRQYETEELMRYVRDTQDRVRGDIGLTTTLEQLRSQYPATISVDDMAFSIETDRDQMLLDLLASGAIECCIQSLAFVSWAAGAPRTARLAVAELQSGCQELTSRTGRSIVACDLFTEILNRADGTQSIADLERHSINWYSQPRDATSLHALSSLSPKPARESAVASIRERARNLLLRMYQLGYFE
jgi:hypothetical protein